MQLLYLLADLLMSLNLDTLSSTCRAPVFSLADWSCGCEVFVLRIAIFAHAIADEFLERFRLSARVLDGPPSLHDIVSV